ncbi:microcystin degradation protein MlrC [Streptomyces spiroverticillatus]|uniref:Microcystin degradation protein MlrC n=1 Tax=Streptomyces finlayi TaxID=67296 RepID=A0A919CAP8_9ACTN|nr:M81 family metallopeptidase [Streptomyces finlayi]GHA15284.1 microcystin degradation protein MlrC [Streptomyces spiroverticillatus]GHC96780.1 microcystin degradation protein MlrC [Streptomyces finlayi]
MSAAPQAAREAARPLRIGIGGVSVECSTFCPHRTTLDDFRITRGRALLARYTWTRPEPDVEWVPLLHAVALPGGPVEPDAYAALNSELVALIENSGPLDGMVYDIHGAMSVIGLTDAEADLTDAVRSALDRHRLTEDRHRLTEDADNPHSAAPDARTPHPPLLSAAMDLHGNVSRRLAERVDLLTAHRLAPHEDEWETRERAARNLLHCLRSGVRPHRAWVQVPVLLPGEKTSTRLEPARSLYGSLAGIESLPGVLDAALWVGYAWADEPRCRAAVVVTGTDQQLIAKHAELLARRYWDARHDFVFVGPTGTADECIARAVESSRRPFLISDSGDNPTAGGAGDLAYMLGRLLAHDAIREGRTTALHPGITDPAAVARCTEAGVGARVTLPVGGKVDSRHGGPYQLTGTVTLLEPGRAAVRCGGLTVVLVERRTPFHTRTDFGGLDPASYDLVVVKIGYLETELYDLAADWLLALTPGGVDQDLQRLGHHRVERPLYPFDQDAYAEGEGPDLTPVLLGPARHIRSPLPDTRKA